MDYKALGVSFDIYVTGIPCSGPAHPECILIQVFKADRTIAAQGRFAKELPVQDAIIELLNKLDETMAR